MPTPRMSTYFSGQAGRDARPSFGSGASTPQSASNGPFAATIIDTVSEIPPVFYVSIDDTAAGVSDANALSVIDTPLFKGDGVSVMRQGDDWIIMAVTSGSLEAPIPEPGGNPTSEVPSEGP